MRSIALLIEYEGSTYSGWQRQPHDASVQQVIEQAIAVAFDADVSIVGSGRTDAGVHARGQVAHVHLPPHANDIPLSKVAIALNTRLPPDIRVRSTSDVDAMFHARFTAKSREYIYDISKHDSIFRRAFSWTPELSYDPVRLAETLTLFEGQHDFTAISKNNPDTKSYVCSVEYCRMKEHSDRFVIRIRADRFVYGMCRSIVGSAMTVARGKIDLEGARSILASGIRSSQLILAPSHGLTLNRVRYANGIFDDETYF